MRKAGKKEVEKMGRWGKVSRAQSAWGMGHRAEGRRGKSERGKKEVGRMGR